MFTTTKTENVIYLIPSENAIVDLNYIFCFKFDFNCNAETFYHNLNNIIHFKSLIYIYIFDRIIRFKQKRRTYCFQFDIFFKKNNI